MFSFNWHCVLTHYIYVAVTMPATCLLFILYLRGGKTACALPSLREGGDYVLSLDGRGLR